MARAQAQHLRHFGHGMPEAPELNNRPLGHREVGQCLPNRHFQLTAHGEVLGIRLGPTGQGEAVRPARILDCFEADDRRPVPGVIDASVGNCLEQELRPVVRQVVTVGVGQEATIAVVNDILGVGLIPDEGPGIGQRAAGSRRDPGVEGVIGARRTKRSSQFRLPVRGQLTISEPSVEDSPGSTTPQGRVRYNLFSGASRWRGPW